MKKAKKNKNIRNRVGITFLFLLFTIIGFFGGYYGIEFIDQNLNVTFSQVFILLIIIYGLYLFQIFIHESGHYVFGRLTGYTFVSFRVGSIMLARDISLFRLLYAYELLFNQDRAAADKQLVLFEKVAKNYPVLSEVDREREMLKFINSLDNIRGDKPVVMS